MIKKAAGKNVCEIDDQLVFRRLQNWQFVRLSGLAVSAVRHQLGTALPPKADIG